MVAGCDEVGRGPLAGDVVAAAVILGRELPQGLNDSKKLTERKREALFETITETAMCWAVGRASVEEIDKINILNASLLAMKRAILLLKKKPTECLVDGPYIPRIEGVNLQAIIKGDSLIPSISAAS